MKDEKLKTCESQNSSKGKSTFDSSKFSDRIKSSKNSIKSKDTPLNKASKRLFDECGVKYTCLDEKYHKVLKLSLKPDEKIEYIK